MSPRSIVCPFDTVVGGVSQGCELNVKARERVNAPAVGALSHRRPLSVLGRTVGHLLRAPNRSNHRHRAPRANARVIEPFGLCASHTSGR